MIRGAFDMRPITCQLADATEQLSRHFITGLLCLLLTIGLWPNSASAHLIVLKDYGNTVSVDNQLQSIDIPSTDELDAAIREQASTIKNKPISPNPLLYHAQSHFTSGPVYKHQASPHLKIEAPFFVVGADMHSIRWLALNGDYLRHIHALPMATNIHSKADVDRIYKQTGWHVIPVHVDGLEQLVGTSHYPFLVYHHWVVQ